MPIKNCSITKDNYVPSLRQLSPKLTREELISRLTSALTFASTNLDQLDDNAKFWKDDGDPFVRLVDKAVVETALLVLLASRIPNLPQQIHSLVESLVHRLAIVARSERNRVLLMRFPHTAASLGITHIVLSHLGERDEEFHQILQRALESGHVTATERIPFRLMDLRWVCAMLSPEAQPDFDDLIPHSILASCAHPIYMTRADAYALTHGMMYVTDFGVHFPPASLDIKRIGAMIDAGLSWNMVSEDLDLMGELLVSFALLRQPWSPHSKYAWHYLSKTWDELGFLPSPSFDVSEYKSLTGDAATAYAFEHIYHTTYVGGMLCAILLQNPEYSEDDFTWKALPCDSEDLDIIQYCNKAVETASVFCQRQQKVNLSNHKIHPPVVKESNADVPHDATNHETPDVGIIINSLVKCPGLPSQSRARWLQVIADVSLNNEELALVLSDALLIQAARQYDLARLAEGLNSTVALSLAPSTTFFESVRFLLRQQVPSGALGAHFLVSENCDSPDAIVITKSLATCLSNAANHIALFAS